MSTRLYTRKENSEKSSNKLWYIFGAFILTLVAMTFMLRWSGVWLVEKDKIDGASWAVVLDGQGRDMTRTSAALELLKKGVADTVVLSGSRIYRTRYNSEFYIKDLIQQGAPANRLIEFRHDAYSTFQEANLLIPYFRELGADTVVLITSNFHSRRAKMVFNALSKNKPHFLIHPIDNPFYHPENWIFEKKAASYWIMEMLKMGSTFLEIQKIDQYKFPKPNWEKWVHGEATVEDLTLEPDSVLTDSLEQDSLIVDLDSLPVFKEDSSKTDTLKG
jgi:uncharacterized SAM-binding protein YcdF (DUF218 family)